jgi:protein-S-isoprenylcysteine O-methyltransferase Ste14
MREETLLIIAIFLAYFILHSLTASMWMKQRIAACCPAIVPYYRLLFNGVATLLALPLVYLAWRYPGEPLWQWQGAAFYLVNALALLAFITLLYSMRLYDMGEFLGLRQARGEVHEIKDMEHFQISAFHRFVRHPWYFLILVILWTRDISTTQLLIYSLVTLYLVIGSRLEERKLIAYHGKVYEAYRKRVAGLFPLPWKILSKDEAEQLLDTYYRQRQ